jgi:hypothetical protein
VIKVEGGAQQMRAALIVAPSPRIGQKNKLTLVEAWKLFYSGDNDDENRQSPVFAALCYFGELWYT